MHTTPPNTRIWSTVASLSLIGGCCAALGAAGLLFSTTDPTLSTGLSVPAALVCGALLACMALGLIARWAHMRATLATLHLLGANRPAEAAHDQPEAAKKPFAPHPIFMARVPR